VNKDLSSVGGELHLVRAEIDAFKNSLSEAEE